MKSIILLFSAILITFNTVAQKEQVTQEEIEQWAMEAEEGDANAQYNLGQCYSNGSGVTKNYKQAAYWWRKAAEQGDAQAQHNLGVCYEHGYGVKKDLQV